MEKAVVTRDDVKAFVNSLRAEVVSAAEGLNGPDVMRVLFYVTDEMCKAGIDRAWDATMMSDREAMDDVFDITWLTLLLYELPKYKKKYL